MDGKFYTYSNHDGTFCGDAFEYYNNKDKYKGYVAFSQKWIFSVFFL